MKISTKKTIILVLVLAAAFSAYYAFSNRTPFDEKKPALGDMAPEVLLADMSGRMVRLSELRGKVVVLNFWASWCPPCKTQVTRFQQVYEKYEKDGLEIIAVAIDEIQPSLVMEMKLSFPVTVANKRVTHDYGDISNVPVTFLIDKEGRIIKKLKEVYPSDALGRDIENALAGRTLDRKS